MIVTLVYVKVIPGHTREFIEASRLNHEGSILEEGNLRFDIIQHSDDPDSFVFYEVFKDEEAIAAHKKSPHYLRWRQTVDTWMAVPRTGVKYKALYPEGKEGW